MDWNTGTHSKLVSIDTHSLYAKITGKDRQPNQPVVIIMHGLTSTMTEWPVAGRLLSQHFRVLDYDRTGYGESEPGPNEPNAENIAKELNALLKSIDLPPPYITVGHSWGGVTTMEFLASRQPGDVAGMVFVDAGPPRYFKVLPVISQQQFVSDVSKDVDYFEATEIRKKTVLSDDEWDAFLAEENSEKHGKQAEWENRIFAETYDVLADKKMLEQSPPVLGTAPVVVLRGSTNRDMTKMYEAGLAKGNGTEQQRREFKDMLDTWEEKDIPLQNDFFKLTSGRTKFMQAEKSGHQIPMTEPELIVDAVSWVMEAYKSNIAE